MKKLQPQSSQPRARFWDRAYEQLGSPLANQLNGMIGNHLCNQFLGPLYNRIKGQLRFELRGGK